MSASSLNVLSFIGGPFDGFDEQLECLDELPRCVALPMSAAASEVFGVPIRRSASAYVAVYILKRREGVASYHFRGMRPAERPRRGTRGTDPSTVNRRDRETSSVLVGNRQDAEEKASSTCEHDRLS